MGKRKSKTTNLDTECINTIRFLAIDAIEKAKSGHPGIALEIAPLLFTLYSRIMRHNPANPAWYSRDRLVLSAGHGVPPLYATLALCGYFSIDELQKLRQWGSLTPGHPEYGLTPGIEATTGPLGQGLAIAVGMAIAERFTANLFNQSRIEVINYHTYCIVSDGDLMEGIGMEAASLAGHLQLGKLIVFYLDNHITIEGETNITYSDDTRDKFGAMGWQVLTVKDAEGTNAICAAADEAKEEPDCPTLICIRSNIGYGSPLEGTCKVHGEPLGTENTKRTKQKLDWPIEPNFYIPEDVWTFFRSLDAIGQSYENIWNNANSRLRSKNPFLHLKFRLIMQNVMTDLGIWWEKAINPLDFLPDQNLATRQASGIVLNTFLQNSYCPIMMSGSADLGSSCKNIVEGSKYFQADCPDGWNIHYGIREHAMGAVMNGLALSGIVPIGSTFLTFAQYMMPAIRLAAMMKLRVIYVFTHDSIGVGEDGPTHQPIEHLAQLRAIPGITVIRPCDADETVEAWKVALENNGPTALILTRQAVPTLDRDKYSDAAFFSRGAYLLTKTPADSQDNIILIASGSEVHLAIATQSELAQKGIKSDVVSMPSWELFEKQPEDYKEQTLPKKVLKIAIEAGCAMGWHKYVGDRGAIISIDRFGASAPGPVLFEKCGFTVDNIVRTATDMLEEQRIQAMKDFRLG